MKAYHNYTTAMTTAFRLRWGMATLLILAALITAQAVQPALASPAQRPQAAAVLPVSRANTVIASCRVCVTSGSRLGRFSRQLRFRYSGPQTTRAPDSSRAAGPFTLCRACRDEWVAAQPVQPAVAALAQRPQAAAVLSISRANALIASCRVCRDEWVAAQTLQSIRAAISASTSGFDIDQQEENTRTSGPR